MFPDIGKYLINFVLIVLAFFLVQDNPGIAWILAGVAAFLLFFFHSRAAIIAYAGFFSFEDFILLHAPVESLVLIKYLGDILILAVFFAMIAKLALRRYTLEPLKDNPIHIPIVLFLICAITSAIVNAVPIFISFIGIRQFLRYVVLFYAIILTAHAEWTQSDLKNLVKIIFILIFVQAVVGYAQILMGPGSEFNKFLLTGNKAALGDVIFVWGFAEYGEGSALFGTVLNPNIYGLFISLGFCLTFGTYVLAPGPLKKYLFYFLIFLAVPLVRSYSRQSMYATFLGVLIISILRKEIKIIFLMAIVVSIFSFYLAQIKEKSTWDRAETSLAEKIVSPFHAKYLKAHKGADRLLVIREMIPKILKSPQGILGFGPGALGSPFGYSKRYFKAFEKLKIPMHMRNMIHIGFADVGFAAIIGQFGMIGFGLFITIFIAVFWTLLTKVLPDMTDFFMKGITLGMIGYTAGLFLANIGNNNLTIRQISFYFWILTGIVCAVRFTDTKEEIEPKI